MTDSTELPGVGAWKTPDGKPLPVEFWRFFRSLSLTQVATTTNTTDLTEITARIETLEGADTGAATYTGSFERVAVYGDNVIDIDPAYDRLTASRISLGF